MDYTSYLHLYAAFPKPQVTNLIKNFCIEEESNKLDSYLASWENAIKELRRIETVEAGLVDMNTTLTLDPNPKIEAIKNDPLFKNSFSNSPIEFAWVELDDLVAIQREVSINYVEQLIGKISANPSVDELIDLCISPKQDVPMPKVTQTPAGWVFSSPSVDFRFLGGYLKENITDDDLKFTSVGARPIKAITLFVGYGSGSVNVVQVGNRLILNNGFHRVYSLYKKGIKKIPVVVQKIGNAALEFPPQLGGLSKEYLLGQKRPIVIKDFFNDKLTCVLKRKQMMRTVKVSFGQETLDFEV